MLRALGCQFYVQSFPNGALLRRALTLLVNVHGPEGGPLGSPGSAQLGSASSMPRGYG